MLESDRASREREWSGAPFGATAFFTCHGGELAIGHGGRMVEALRFGCFDCFDMVKASRMSALGLRSALADRPTGRHVGTL